MPAAPPIGHCVHQRQQILWPHTSHYYVFPFTGYCGIHGPGSGNASSNSTQSTMKFYQRTARGDSKMFIGGRGFDDPLQRLCQGNGAAPAWWLIISSVLMHCCQCKGFGSQIITPISGTFILTLLRRYTWMTLTSLSLNPILQHHRPS